MPAYDDEEAVMRLRAATVLASVAALVAIAAPPALAGRLSPHGQPASAGRLSAEIRYTTGGIPHILAHDWTSLGFGYGYAFAQDNLCTMANDYVTVEAHQAPGLRAGRRGHPALQRGRGQQPGLRPVLPADHRFRRGAAPGAGARPHREAGGDRVHQGLQRLPRARGGRGGRARPDLPRPGLGEADHRDGQLPALLPAHAAG